jgi:hypothetical protein
MSPIFLPLPAHSSLLDHEFSRYRQPVIEKPSAPAARAFAELEAGLAAPRANLGRQRLASTDSPPDAMDRQLAALAAAGAIKVDFSLLPR